MGFDRDGRGVFTGGNMTPLVTHVFTFPAIEDRRWHDMRDWLAGIYGEEIGTFLAKRMGSAIRKTGPDPCIDNLRVCDVANRDEAAEYERQRAVGCCGSSENKITHYKTGRTFRFGFNFGH